MKKLDIIVKIPSNRGIKIPDKFQQTFRDILKYCEEKRNGYLRVQISPPFKHRSTGEKSQNHAINGFIQQLANYTGDDFDYLKTEAKRRAIKRGYPFSTSSLGDVVPFSETEISEEEAGYLIEEIKDIAAILCFKLRE